jgi:hypothetical protein
MSDPVWLNKHTKSVLAKTVVTVTGNKDCNDIPVSLTIEALILDYAPLIHLDIKSSVPLYEKDFLDWIDHPFLFLKDIEEGNTVGNIIDDTPATRALIDELIKPLNTKLYTTTHCTHVRRLIQSLQLFWS